MSLKCMDVLDPRTNILYCSPTCAEKAGIEPADCRAFSQADYDYACKRSGERLGSPYGAFCPVCENLYNSF